MALMDWLTWKPFGNNDAAPGDTVDPDRGSTRMQTKPQATNGIDIMQVLRAGNDARSGKGEFVKGLAPLSDPNKKPDATGGFWSSLFGQ